MSRRTVSRCAIAAALLAPALSLMGCGRALPTGPVGASEPALARPQARPTSGRTDLEVAVALLAPGASGAAVAATYGATLLGGSTETCGRFAPGAGEPCDTLIEHMSGDSRVQAVERDAYLETAESRQESYASDDGFGSEQTWLEQPAATVLHLDAAHAVSQGRGVTVAVLDTGIDPNHPALRDRVVPGHDFVGGDADPTDVPDGIDNDGDGRIDEAYGHGTHVAGIVALTAPGARIMPVRVLDADGRGTLAAIVSGLGWALDHGAQVVSMSFGMLRNSDAIQNLLEVAQSRGVVIVCSAGNWGAENPREYPAASSHANAIGATDAAAHPAAFSSFGSQLTLCAPGVGIRSAYPGGGWRIWSGTSMSTPFVAGTAALLLERHPGWGAEQVFARLGASASPIVGVNSVQLGKLGNGMLDAGAALSADATTPPSPADDVPNPKLVKAH